MAKLIKALTVLLVFALGWTSLALAEFPKQPEGRVSDFTQTLSPADKDALNQLSQNLEKSNGAQLAVVTVASLDGLSVEEYTHKLFNRWGVGHKGKDDGIMLLVAPTERKVRIEVGYGLEGVINDAKAGRILDEFVVPYFKAGDYAQGIVSGSQHIAAAITGDESHVTVTPPPAASPESPLGWMEKLLIMGFFGLFVGLGFLALGIGFRGEKFFILWGGGFGGIPLGMSFLFGYAMGFPVYILPCFGGVMLLVGLIFGKKINASLKSNVRKRGSWGGGGWSSGGGSSSSSSSSSSSGSSFGGGSSGGGGSSRSW